VSNPGRVRRFRARSPTPSFLLTLCHDQILRIFNQFGDNPHLLSLYVLGQDWVLWTPQGYYAASPKGERLIRWVVHHGIDRDVSVHPAVQFRERFYRPDIIRLVLDKGSVEEALAAANADRK
jgi:hypothetical protein